MKTYIRCIAVLLMIFTSTVFAGPWPDYQYRVKRDLTKLSLVVQKSNVPLQHYNGVKSVGHLTWGDGAIMDSDFTDSVGFHNVNLRRLLSQRVNYANVSFNSSDLQNGNSISSNYANTTWVDANLRGHRFLGCNLQGVLWTKIKSVNGQPVYIFSKNYDYRKQPLSFQGSITTLNGQPRLITKAPGLGWYLLPIK